VIDSANSFLHQVAQGRPGVMYELFLVNVKQLEIKMAQDSKPG
jgi:glutamate synthase domain-containing protein 2